jgi:hypothetical protein
MGVLHSIECHASRGKLFMGNIAEGGSTVGQADELLYHDTSVESFVSIGAY